MPFIYTNKRCGKCELETMLDFESDEALLYFLSEDQPKEDQPQDEEMPAIRTGLECFMQAIMTHEEKTGKRPETATLGHALKLAIEGELKKEIVFDGDSMPTIYGVFIVPPSSLSDIYIS